MKLTRKAILLPAFAAILALSADVRADEDRPTLRRLGKTVVQYEDADAKVVVGFRYANAHPGSPWLYLEVGMTASGKPVEVAREDISLVTPSGERIPLPAQKRVIEDFPDARRVFMAANIANDPIEGYFPSTERRERLGFFSVPGEAIVFQNVTLNHRTLTLGPLLFQSRRGAFANGSYVLEIQNKWMRARVPFEIPARELSDEPSDPKKVTW
ncbi:MAG TPA: hypothetical protein VGR00_03645 [Thermoanaerobaculia bacterium]|jgi:hypothetical protein|nr:hypothetical protein [Thermoanaerobaculia bacterium]